MYFLLKLALLFAVLLSGCSSSASSLQDNLAMESLEAMPAEVKAAPLPVQQAYQFAVANPEIMKQIPCYCGCGAMGHTSNYACYVSELDANGSVSYDTHALGCSICVDITHDTLRLLQQGKTVSEIKLYVDQTYSLYGPSNIP
jgi:hypothetical protein